MALKKAATFLVASTMRFQAPWNMFAAWPGDTMIAYTMKAATVQSTIFLTIFMVSPGYGVLRWSQLCSIMPKQRPIVGKARRGTVRSHVPVQTVSGIAKTRHDVPAVVELLVDGAGNQTDWDVQVGHVSLKPRDALRGRKQGDRSDIVRAQVDEVADGCGKGAARGKHRVEHIALAPREVFGQPVRIRRGLQCDLVAHHPEEADLGGRQQPHHAVQHAQARAQDRHDQRFR